MTLPLTLGLETATHSGGAALLGADGLVGSVCFHTKRLYSQRVLPSVEWLLNQTELSVGDVEAVGVSIGPGSFTGLRIGLSVAKALAYAGNAQIVGVGTLEALAVRASGGADALVCPLLDARHEQVYAALYQVTWHHGSPQVKELRPEWAGPVNAVADWITDTTLFTGDALNLAREKLQPALGDRYRETAPVRARAHPEEVALIAASRASRGEVDNPVLLEPRYVRQSYAK